MRLRDMCLVVAVLLCGCKSPKPVVTYVSLDLAAIEAANLGKPFPTIDVPAPPAAIGPQTIRREAVPAKRIATPAKDYERIQKTLEEQQEITRRKLQRQLQAFYAREARRFELDAKAAQTELEKAQYAAANLKVRAAFEALAAQRMPRVARLALLAGFPDPNPRSDAPSERLGNVSQQRFDEAKRIREELNVLDADFEKVVKQVVEETAAGLSQKQTEMLIQIEEFKIQKDLQAEKEAADQVTAAREVMRMQLADRDVTEAPAIPARSLTIPGNPPMAAAPKVTFDPIFTDRAFLRKRLKAQARIWLGLNGYSEMRGARDATAEFLAWQKQNEFGNSAN